MDLTLISLFCVIDDFCQELLPQWNAILLEDTNKKRNKPSQMSTSEIMTIMIYFHKSNYRNFKMYYLHVIKGSMVKYFPNSVSYNRFVELMPSILLPLCFFIAAQGKTATGIYFVDSTILRVCHEKRASQNRAFKGLAKKSKSTMGWYYGFKLHIIVNDKVCLILGDNIFYGQGLQSFFTQAMNQLNGSVVFGYTVNDPERYGVITLDQSGKIESIEEKPKKPKSNSAIPGIYFFDNEVIHIAKALKPSKRGELEITDALKAYLAQGKLQVIQLCRGFCLARHWHS